MLVTVSTPPTSSQRGLVAVVQATGALPLVEELKAPGGPASPGGRGWETVAVLAARASVPGLVTDRV